MKLSACISFFIILLSSAMPVTANTEAQNCLKSYSSYLSNVQASRLPPKDLVLYLAEMCMHETANKNSPQSLKLLQPVDDIRRNISFKRV